MKNKRIIKSSLIIAFILFVFLIVLFINNNAKKKSNINIEEGKYNTTVFNQIDIENLDANSIGSDSPLFALIEKEITDPDKIDYEGQIKRIKLSLANVSDEIQAHIKDKEKFAYCIKKYFYENGILDGDIITLTNSKMQDNKLTMFFKMNDKRTSTLEIIYNIVDDTTDVSLIINHE